MISKIKKPVSILLSLIMVFSVFTIVPLSASAAVGDVLSEDDYLTFTAEEAGSTVTLNVASGSDFQYDLNGDGLTAYTPGTTITLENKGDSVRFSGKDTTFNYSNHFSLTGKVACSGNVMSLRLDDDGKVQGLAQSCFDSMFYNCTSLTQAPELPETELVGSCYYRMFYNCTSLTQAPELPATNLANSCYSYMFYRCESLTKAPELPATNLANSCYSYMFCGCTRLTKAPELPATELVDSCYYRMFYGCTSLTKAPELPATNLANSCYSYMFSGCTRLTKAPELPATNLAESCYSNMFYGCERLTELPALPATTLARNCYNYMFNGCSKICISDEAGTFGDITYSAEYRIPTTGEGTSAYNALYNMFRNTGGQFTAGTPDINTTYYVPAPAPTTYTITDASVNGTVTASVNGTNVTEAEENADVTLTVAPAEGYQFVSISAGDVSLTTVTEGSQYSFTMPNKPVTVTAVFEEIPAPETFKVYVKKPTNETYTTIENLTGETTVAQLKEIIADQIDIPVTAQQMLIFAGKKIDDAKTLAEYNIGNESTIFLVIRGYTVTWLNYDDSELGTTTVQYGATPSYDGEEPTKEEDANYTYTFSGWTSSGGTFYAKGTALPAVSGNETYTAVFTATPKAVPAKLTINVGENGKVVMDNGTFGNATDASNIVDITAPINVTDGSKVFIVDDQTANIVEGGSINIATGGEVSFYPSADNTGVITAIPDEGYFCTGWYNGNTLYSSGAALAYQNISEDITLTAKFAPVPAFDDGVGERLAGYTLSLDGDIGVNFYMELAPEIAQSETAVMHFTIPNGNKTNEIDVPVSEATVSGKYHIFKCNVAAKEMTSVIKAQIIDGETTGTEYTYSVKEYADYLLTNADPEGTELEQAYAEASDLVVAMLNYGANAQLYFTPDTDPDDLANSGCETDLSGVTAQTINKSTYTNELNDVAEFSGATLSLKTQTTLSLYFTSDVDLTFNCAHEFEVEKKSGYQIIRIRNIHAKNLMDDFTVTVTAGENTGSVTYSPMNYCYNVLSDETQPEALQNACRALYLYAKAADVYFD